MAQTPCTGPSEMGLILSTHAQGPRKAAGGNRMNKNWKVGLWNGNEHNGRTQRRRFIDRSRQKIHRTYNADISVHTIDGGKI